MADWIFKMMLAATRAHFCQFRSAEAKNADAAGKAGSDKISFKKYAKIYQNP
jgi:hypothetical protein